LLGAFAESGQKETCRPQRTEKDILAAAGETAKAPSFSAYIRLFELAEDYDRDLAVAFARRPQNRTEIAECRERLARTLKDLLPYEKPRLTTTKVQGDKNYPLFDLSTLSDSELAFLRRTVLKAQQVGIIDQPSRSRSRRLRRAVCGPQSRAG
jgi:hypothetical protein